jgi:hypothetical protein
MKGITPWLLVGGAAIVGIILYMNSQSAGGNTGTQNGLQATSGTGAQSGLTPTTNSDVLGIVSPTSNVGTPISNGGSLYPILDPATGITYLFDATTNSLYPISSTAGGSTLVLPSWANLPTGSNPGAVV